MLQTLMDGIRGAGRRFFDERRRESDGGEPFRRGATRGYRAALPVVCKLLLVAVMLNPFAVYAQTTEIVASGFWNVARLDPSCNYTDPGTFNVTHANGAYSATIYFSGHHMGPDCQSQGAEGVTINLYGFNSPPLGA